MCLYAPGSWMAREASAPMGCTGEGMQPRISPLVQRDRRSWVVPPGPRGWRSGGVLARQTSSTCALHRVGMACACRRLHDRAPRATDQPQLQQREAPRSSRRVSPVTLLLGVGLPGESTPALGTGPELPMAAEFRQAAASPAQLQQSPSQAKYGCMPLSSRRIRTRALSWGHETRRSQLQTGFSHGPRPCDRGSGARIGGTVVLFWTARRRRKPLKRRPTTRGARADGVVGF